MLKELLEANGLTEKDLLPKNPVKELNAKIEGLMTFMGLTGSWNGDVFEVVKEKKESGDYTNPILIPENGITTVTGKWYYTTDKELPHEAKQNAFVTTEDFFDRTWFDFVE